MLGTRVGGPLCRVQRRRDRGRRHRDRPRGSRHRLRRVVRPRRRHGLHPVPAGREPDAPAAFRAGQWLPSQPLSTGCHARGPGVRRVDRAVGRAGHARRARRDHRADRRGSLRAGRPCRNAPPPARRRRRRAARRGPPLGVLADVRGVLPRRCRGAHRAQPSRRDHYRVWRIGGRRAGRHDRDQRRRRGGAAWGRLARRCRCPSPW